MSMSSASRIKNVYLNSSITLITQILQVIIGFVIRNIFISTLGVSYLGYNSVFQNILQMLNLADMGIGIAITSFLYKPLADGNKARVATLMYIYKKIYNIMGIIVMVFGIFISCFLNILIPDAQCSFQFLLLLYFINLFGTVSTYYLAYNRTWLIADQKSYICSLIDTVIYFIISIVQIIVLLCFADYVLYLILTIAKNIISNYIIMRKVKKDYKDKAYTIKIKYIEEYKPQIFGYVKEVFISKIGSYIYYSTDNIIISVFKGSLTTGFLSNYTMITTQVMTLVNQVLASIQSTFGNFINADIKNIKSQRDMTDIYLCANFIIGNLCMLFVLFLVQPFIQLIFGKSLLLEMSVVFWLSFNLLLTIMIQVPSQVFMIYKLFRYDRYIVIVSALCNIIISVALVKDYGVNGCLIGTFFTSLIYLFSRLYIISRKIYHVPFYFYVRNLLLYGFITFFSIIVLNELLPETTEITLTKFIFRIIVVGLISGGFTIGLLIKKKEFKYLVCKIFPYQITCMKHMESKLLLIALVMLVCGFCIVYLNFYKN